MKKQIQLGNLQIFSMVTGEVISVELRWEEEGALIAPLIWPRWHPATNVFWCPRLTFLKPHLLRAAATIWDESHSLMPRGHRLGKPQLFQRNQSSRGGGRGTLSSLLMKKETQLRCTRGICASVPLETLGLRACSLSGNLKTKLQAQLLTSAQWSFEHLISDNPFSAPKQTSPLNHL